MSCPVRIPRRSASPPTAGDSRTTPLSAIQDFSGADTDEAPTLRQPRPSKFMDLSAFPPRYSLGKTPTRGLRASPFASLGGLTSSLRELVSDHP